jgi:integrase
MSRGGSVYRRCTGCRKRMRDATCPCGHTRYSWTYTIDVAQPGAPRRQVYRSGFKTKADAVGAMQAEQVDRRRGAFVEPDRTTFGQYAERWMSHHAEARVKLGRLKATTLAIYERDLRLHLRPTLEHLPLQSVDSGTLTHLYARLTDTLSPKSIRNVHGLAHRILEDARRDGLLLNNPAKDAEPPTAEDHEHATWTVEEVARFLAHIAGDDPGWHAMFTLMAACGLRRGEALGLRWSDVDLDGGALTVAQIVTTLKGRAHVSTPKTQRSRRTLELAPELVAMLREQRRRQAQHRLAFGGMWQDHGLVFPRPDGLPINPTGASKKFRTYADRCGLESIGPHGLRHSFASALDASGEGLATISALLGHASTVVTGKVYTHMLKGAGGEAIARHTAALFGAAVSNP